MCGIVGYLGQREAVSFLIPALRRLEYRGYDSAGVATLNGSGIEIRKSSGKISALEASIGTCAPQGKLGIAHTRWATHGRPSKFNAHPHVDCDLRFAIVHNGIIENYRELKEALIEEGHRFRSETDSEVIAHLIERHGAEGLVAGARRAMEELSGAFAVACIAEDDPRLLVAFRSGGPPLVVGRHEDEVFLASDAHVLVGEADDMLILEDGEIAVLTPSSISLLTARGAEVRRASAPLPTDAEKAEKGGHPHFMLKEIFEQPAAIQETLRGRVEPGSPDVHIPELAIEDPELVGLIRLCFVACGSSWHAALVGKYLVESLARLPVEVDIASEFRSREPVVDSRVLAVTISQSGETADTLAAQRHARALGSRTVSICNVVGSSLAREADGVISTRAGLEIGVASTKAFTAQIAAVALLAIKLGLARGMLDAGTAMALIRDLHSVPSLMADPLGWSDRIRAVAERFADRRDFLYLGRGIYYPLALEGALKLKEISYIHAEGYPAGEMKHGPIALIDEGLPVVAITPLGSLYEKMTSNIEEVKARGGTVIAVSTTGDETIARRADVVLPIPPLQPRLQPLLAALPLQLLAYHLGVLRGCDVDQPRNLAKSVTVE